MLRLLKWGGVIALILGAALFFRLQAASPADDLSAYRGYHFGTDLTDVLKQAGLDPSQVKVIHTRPALVQDVEWRPRNGGAFPEKESVNGVVFSFYDGKLFRVAVDYDRYETEGMTSEDFVEAVSAVYGTAGKPDAPVKAADTYSYSDQILAEWQDPQYRFDLIRQSYGPSFRLVGISKQLATLADTADSEAKRLDDQEAPQRDAARIASEAAAAKTKSDNARLVNKPKFRP